MASSWVVLGRRRRISLDEDIHYLVISIHVFDRAFCKRNQFFCVDTDFFYRYYLEQLKVSQLLFQRLFVDPCTAVIYPYHTFCPSHKAWMFLCIFSMKANIQPSYYYYNIYLGREGKRLFIFLI